MQADRRKGFTLIEVMMVLAISSLMSLVLLGLYRGTQSRTQFRDAIERTSVELEQVKTEVNSSYTTGSGTDLDRVFFGKAVTFADGSNTFEVRAITADRTSDGSLVAPALTNSVTYTIPWNVVCQDSDCGGTIVFTRNLTDGLLNTYVIPAGQDLEQASTYSTVNSVANVSLTFALPSAGLTADIIISGSSNEVTRSYTN